MQILVHGPMISSDVAADRLILSMNRAGKTVNNLQLQKLLYYAQGIHLAATGQPLFADDFEAWIHGPVIPRLFGRLKRFEWKPISDAAIEDRDRAESLEDEKAESLDYVVARLGHLDGTALERKTKGEPPWILARGMLPNDEPSHKMIAKELIREYFESLVPPKLLSYRPRRTPHLPRLVLV